MATTQGNDNAPMMSACCLTVADYRESGASSSSAWFMISTLIRRWSGGFLILKSFFHLILDGLLQHGLLGGLCTWNRYQNGQIRSG